MPVGPRLLIVVDGAARELLNSSPGLSRNCIANEEIMMPRKKCKKVGY